MSGTTYESSPGALDGDAVQAADGTDAAAYRAVAGTAIAAAILAALSPLAFLDWWLVAVPLLGIVFGILGLRTIRQRPDEFTGTRLACGAVLVSAACLGGGLAFLSMVYARELPEGFVRLDYAMLQPLPGDPPLAIPDSAVAMDGRNVLLKGYMYPGKQQRGIVQFLLVRDQGDCCFGGNPKITDRVLVQLRDPARPQGIDFSQRLTKIAGRFVIRPAGTDAVEGGVLYHLEDAVAR
jgi:hypothetical protein